MKILIRNNIAIGSAYVLPALANLAQTRIAGNARVSGGGTDILASVRKVTEGVYHLGISTANFLPQKFYAGWIFILIVYFLYCVNRKASLMAVNAQDAAHNPQNVPDRLPLLQKPKYTASAQHVKEDAQAHDARILRKYKIFQHKMREKGKEILKKYHVFFIFFLLNLIFYSIFSIWHYAADSYLTEILGWMDHR